MKYPSLAPALCFAGGVGAAFWWGGRLEILCFAASLALIACWVHSRARMPGLAIALFFVGWLYHLERIQPHRVDDLRNQVGLQPELITLRGQIDDIPTFRLAERQGHWAGRTLVPLRVAFREVSERGNPLVPASGAVMVTTPGALSSDFYRGQQVAVTGVISRPPGPLADQLFDYRNYLAHQGIGFILRTEGPKDWTLLENPADRRLSAVFLPWAQKALTRGLPDDETTRLIVAMALGWKTPLTGEVNDVFMQSGTMHVFAISGLHIGLIAWILVEVLRMMRLSRAWCGWFAIPLVWFYVGATGWQASAIRSAIMSSVVVAGWAIHRPGNLLNSLAVSGWIILVWDPGQLFQASFQLSFAAVAGLAILGPPLSRWWVEALRIPTDPLLPATLTPRWRGYAQRVLRWLGEALAVGFATLLASLPLTVHWFHLINPVSLAANLVVVPLSSLALVANFASVLTAFWVPVVSEIFNASAWVLMRGMVSASEWAAHLPLGHAWVESPPWLWWLPYYLALIGVALGWLKSPRLRFPFQCGLASAALLAAIAWQFHRSETRIAVLGSDALVELGAEGAQLFDGGNERSAEWLTAPYLRAHGVNHLAAQWATGESIQQIGGASNLIAEFHPRELWQSAIPNRGVASKRLATVCAERRITLGGAALDETHRGWKTLHPASDDTFSRGEDRSLVLVREVEGYRIAWLGELGRPGQQRLFEREIPRVDIVVGQIPLNSEPMGSALLSALSPQLIILASGRYPASRRIKPATRERLGELGIPVVYTDDTGSVLMRFRPGSLAKIEGDGWSRFLPRPKTPDGSNSRR